MAGAIIAASIAAVFSIIAVILGIRNANTDQSRQLSFMGRQDTRVIYATALAALKKYEIEPTEACETTARIAVSAVELVRPSDVTAATCELLAAIHDPARTPAQEAWDKMVQGMQAALIGKPLAPKRHWSLGTARNSELTVNKAIEKELEPTGSRRVLSAGRYAFSAVDDGSWP